MPKPSSGNSPLFRIRKPEDKIFYVESGSDREKELKSFAESKEQDAQKTFSVVGKAWFRGIDDQDIASLIDLEARWGLGNQYKDKEERVIKLSDTTTSSEGNDNLIHIRLCDAADAPEQTGQVKNAAATTKPPKLKTIFDEFETILNDESGKSDQMKMDELIQKYGKSQSPLSPFYNLIKK